MKIPQNHPAYNRHDGRGRDTGCPVPPHASRRAALPRRALGLGSDAKAVVRIRMHNSRCGEPAVRQLAGAVPRDSTLLVAAASEHLAPSFDNGSAECVQTSIVARHSVVWVVTRQDRREPLPHLGDAVVDASAKRCTQRLELGLSAIPPWRGASVVRCSFTVQDSHSPHRAGFARHCLVSCPHPPGHSFPGATAFSSAIIGAVVEFSVVGVAKEEQWTSYLRVPS